jgi:hypothetical protein
VSDALLELRIRRLAVGVLCGCLALVLGTAVVVVSPRLRQALGLGRVSPAYQVDEVVDLPPDAYTGAEHTLVVIARASCAACQAVRPALLGLIGQIRGIEGVRISVVMPDNRIAEGAEYVRDLGLPESSFVPLTLRKQLRVRAVPTALLVDRAGKILAVCEGVEAFHEFTRLVLSRVDAS